MAGSAARRKAVSDLVSCLCLLFYGNAIICSVPGDIREGAAGFLCSGDLMVGIVSVLFVAADRAIGKDSSESFSDPSDCLHGSRYCGLRLSDFWTGMVDDRTFCGDRRCNYL